MPLNSLSPRELECLLWTGLGKTADEIGDILRISKRTVDHHIQACIAKLNAANKTHAVAKAFTLAAVSGARYVQERSTVFAQMGDDEQLQRPQIVKRRNIPLKAIDEQDNDMRLALIAWQRYRQSGNLPPEGAIEEICSMNGTPKHTHILNVTDRNNFKFELIDPIACRMAAYLSEGVIQRIPSPALRAALTDDFSGVIFSGAPEYNHVAAAVEGITYSYSRLVLPVSNNGRDVSKMAVMVNRRSFSNWRVTA